MRLVVEHRTTYRFSAPQRRLVQLLRVTPADSHDQTVARWAIHVDCDARLRTGRDGFGNITTMLYVEGDVESIDIAVSGEVVTSHADGTVRGVAEPLPPALYLRPTPLTPRDPAIATWAAEVAGDAERLAALHALNRALHARGEADPGRAPPGRDAAVAWAEHARTPRDLAPHLHRCGAVAWRPSALCLRLPPWWRARASALRLGRGAGGRAGLDRV